MAKILVQAFKKGGKFYTEETYNIDGFPTVYNQPKNTTIEELGNMQIRECFRIRDEIFAGRMLCYCPVNKWEGFYFIINGIFEDNEQGFLTYLMDRTGEQ
jgi:hypothetical protein